MKMICWSHTFLLQYEIKQSDVWAVHTCVWTIQKTPKNVQNSFWHSHALSHSHYRDPIKSFKITNES